MISDEKYARRKAEIADLRAKIEHMERESADIHARRNRFNGETHGLIDGHAGPWHFWFAWWPVTAVDPDSLRARLTWLRRVERRFVHEDDDADKPVRRQYRRLPTTFA